LAHWESGTRVYRVDSSLLVLLPSAKWIDAATAPGTPVVRLGEIWTAAPLHKSEIEAIGAQNTSLVIVRDGMLSSISLSSLPPENLAAWLDIDDFTVVAAKPHWEAEPQPARPVAPPKTLREIIAAVPAASPKAEQFLTNLAAEQKGTRGPELAPWLGSCGVFEAVVPSRVAPFAGVTGRNTGNAEAIADPPA
jgi:MoxR-vWA-beta-propeller ternary system domain bpX6